MTVAAASAPRSVRARVWGGMVAGWAVVTGVAPHVLHHVGPLAGAALLAGFGGKAIFFVLGLVLSLPMLRRLLAALFTFSSVVVAPRLTGTDPSPAPGIEQPSDHASHHLGDGK